MVAGLDATTWVALFDASHTAGWVGPQRVAWPDGGTTLEQCAVTVKMFDVIAAALEAERADK